MKVMIGGLAAILAFAIASGPASAEPAHAGDIEVSVVFGALGLAGYHEVEYGTGIPIFEGALNTLLAGPRYRTTDPGFVSEEGAFQGADSFNLTPVLSSSLDFWNGVAWQDAVPRGETLTVRDSLDEDLVFTASGFSQSGGFTGFLADGGTSGTLHQHISFTLGAVPAGLPGPSVGAYRIALQLTSPQYSPSTPFYLVLNRGLATEAFEESIHAMAVPEPETWGLVALGLGLVGAAARRRRT